MYSQQPVAATVKLQGFLQTKFCRSKKELLGEKILLK